MLGAEPMNRFDLFKKTGDKVYLTIGCEDEDTEKTIKFLQEIVNKGIIDCVTFYEEGKEKIILDWSKGGMV